jgi:hypothetical protein
VSRETHNTQHRRKHNVTNIQTLIEDIAYRMIEHDVFDGRYRPYLRYNGNDRQHANHYRSEVQPKIEPTVKQVIKYVCDFHNRNVVDEPVDISQVDQKSIVQKLEARFDIHKDEQDPLSHLRTSYDAHLLEALHQR